MTHSGPPGWGLCSGLTTRSRKNYLVTETINSTSFTNSVLGRTGAPYRRSMTHCSQTRQEATELMTPLRPRATQKKAPELLSQKKPTLLGTWNARTLRETGRCAQAVREMNQYHLTLLGMCEVRWNSHGETRLQTGEVLLYSGKDSDDDRHEAGVSLLLSKHAAKSLIEWEPVSDRIITARFVS